MNKEHNKYLQKRDAGVIQETDNSHKGDLGKCRRSQKTLIRNNFRNKWKNYWKSIEEDTKMKKKSKAERKWDYKLLR